MYILMQEEKDIEVSESITNYIDRSFLTKKPFVIKHVSDIEMLTMKKQIESHGFLNERLPHSIFNVVGYGTYNYFVGYLGEEDKIHIVNYNDSKSKGENILEESGLSYNEENTKFHLDRKNDNTLKTAEVVYTDVEYQDLIDYYKEVSLQTESVDQIDSRIANLQEQINKLQEMKESILSREEKQLKLR